MHLDGLYLPARKRRPINGKHFSAPLSSKDTPSQLDLQAEIRQKFESILRPTAELETSGLDNLAIEHWNIRSCSWRSLMHTPSPY